MKDLKEIISTLKLQPHPEGGYYRETYRSTGVVHSNSLNTQYTGERNYATCIYFLLTSSHFSAFHRINQDEIWHFYDGSPIRLHTLSPSGQHETFSIGRDFAKGEVPQLVVPGGYWFAAEVLGEDNYALVGCTVAPGFDFDDFELPTRSEMLRMFPQHKSLITAFTRDE
ncbi:cupin domain-containing protein [Spongiimicrobium salis]|uniref:cupin domain-containing protein n=1 Tax=Spongiimicrobium salis TaxID=1667022 RepID=UPI00374CAB53